jgi:hypothetical protein
MMNGKKEKIQRKPYTHTHGSETRGMEGEIRSNSMYSSKNEETEKEGKLNKATVNQMECLDLGDEGRRTEGNGYVITSNNWRR